MNMETNKETNKEMTEEEKIFAGQLFFPGDPTLKAYKLKAHNLCHDYNMLSEDRTEEREAILKELLGEMGEGTFLQRPITFHYGRHTRIGKNCFFNFNLTVQDDGRVIIEDGCDFGPNVTIVTAMHPLLADERKRLLMPDGSPRRLCYAPPVRIGKNCWICANAVICAGVTIGEGTVIGAGSVVTRDIPAHCLAAGNPCRVIRPLTDKDSMANKPELLGEHRIAPPLSGGD